MNKSLKKTETTEVFESLYMNKMQAKATVVDSNILICEVARAAGKTEGIFGPRMIRVGADMPGELSFLIHKTYVALMSNIIPNLRAFFSKPVGPGGRPLMEEGKHYVIGESKLPKHFLKPRYPVAYPKHSIIMYTGHQFQLVSSDQPDSMAGRSGVHAFIEEMKHNKGEKLKARIFPGLRGGKGRTRQSPYYEGITGVSDTARVDIGEDDWFFEFEKNVDEELISEIVTASLYLNEALVNKIRLEHEIAREKDHDVRARKQRQLKKFTARVNLWDPRLREMRHAATYYLKASTFVNKDFLGPKFFKTQLETLLMDEFLTAICNIRMLRVTDMFFSGFKKLVHTFDDSYIYDSILKFDLKETFTLRAEYLKHYDPKEPLIIGYDPGNFCSIVVGQEKRKENEIRILKEFFCWIPLQQGELARLFDTFFGEFARNRKVILYADRAGNKRKVEQDKITTDSRLLKAELESYKFRVDLRTEKQRTIFYYEHLKLLTMLLAEDMRALPKLRIDVNECSNLVSAIHLTPVKRDDGKIEMDKSSERKVAMEYQAGLTPQLPSALTYLLFGLYEKLLPKEMKKGVSIPANISG
ncbi:MAG: hypothetical protein KAR19_03720 [Bacteroidales bacterium]|nr:hypothetical protein [Bacteroidales bacterium]